MKDATEIFSSFRHTADVWSTALAVYTPEQFSRKPATDEWSIGQVYFHLVVGTERFHLAHIRRCLEGDDATIGGRKSIPGRILFLIGGFPRRKIHVPPSPQYTPRQPTNTEMQKGMVHLVGLMEGICSSVSGAPTDRKSTHPRLGALNALEWYHLIEMHFRHHLRQKARLDGFLLRAAA